MKVKKDKRSGLFPKRKNRDINLVFARQALIGLLSFLLLAACTQKREQRGSGLEQGNQKMIQNGAALLKDGDLVLRTGRDYISFVLRQFSLTDQTYSHCGIVRIEDGETWVYHAIGGEENPGAALRKESFSAFCDPEYNLGFGIFRYKLNRTEKNKLDQLADRYFKAQTPFDMKFNLQSDSAFYCSEFVYKVVVQATDSSYLPVTQLGDFKYVAIDNLFINKHTHPIYRVTFQ